MKIHAFEWQCECGIKHNDIYAESVFPQECECGKTHCFEDIVAAQLLLHSGQPCGHPKSSIVSSDGDTAYCKDCDEVFRLAQLRKFLEQSAEALGCTRELAGYCYRLESRTARLERGLNMGSLPELTPEDLEWIKWSKMR